MVSVRIFLGTVTKLISTRKDTRDRGLTNIPLRHVPHHLTLAIGHHSLISSRFSRTDTLRGEVRTRGGRDSGLSVCHGNLSLHSTVGSKLRPRSPDPQVVTIRLHNNIDPSHR